MSVAAGPKTEPVRVFYSVFTPRGVLPILEGDTSKEALSQDGACAGIRRRIEGKRTLYHYQGVVVAFGFRRRGLIHVSCERRAIPGKNGDF